MDVTTSTHRWLLGVVAVIVLVTGAGLVTLWPSADALPAVDEAPEPLVTAEVTAVELTGEAADPAVGGGAVADVQVRLLEGDEVGRDVTLRVDLDGLPAIEPGARVELARTVGPDGDVDYFVTDFRRLPTLALLVGLFIAAVLVVGRWHGLRSLLGLAISLLLIVRFVVPAILAGQNPPLVALVGALAVMVVTLYLAHGVNEMTTAAIVGTAGALVLTVLLALVFIDQAAITGFASEDAVFARQQVDGLDLQGLVLAGLIIAALGVLDDVTVSQASTVFALHETDRTLAFPALFARAMKVGRDHIASVVNTLFLAYAGASLALLVIFSTGGLATAEIVNSEVLAVEIVKTVVGSLGL
ncbi:MAG: YibE/F family protein, partial [Nitriliruptor sp.]